MPMTTKGTNGDHDAVERLLQSMGEDPNREGLRDTPARVRKAWAFFSSGYGVKPESVLKTFGDGAEGTDEMVFQGSIPLWSMCEHHMLPFWGVAHIGYLPAKRVLGLSKFSRLVDVYARRLQVQERMTTQIADALMEHLSPLGCGVVLQCRHSCMEARGVQRAGSVTTTTALRASFKDHAGARDEFLSLVRMEGGKQW